jgi:very-short-patch-repair endonuclease
MTTERLPIQEFAQKLRDNPTPAETMILPHLTERGFHFQTIIGPFVVDFYGHGIVIEIDGGYHNQKVAREYDRYREDALTGYPILRFANDAVTAELDKCLQAIDAFIAFREIVQSMSSPCVTPRAVHIAERKLARLTADQLYRAAQLQRKENAEKKAAARRNK